MTLRETISACGQRVDEPLVGTEERDRGRHGVVQTAVFRWQQRTPSEIACRALAAGRSASWPLDSSLHRESRRRWGNGATCECPPPVAVSSPCESE